MKDWYHKLTSFLDKEHLKATKIKKTSHGAKRKIRWQEEAELLEVKCERKLKAETKRKKINIEEIRNKKQTESKGINSI